MRRGGEGKKTRQGSVGRKGGQDVRRNLRDIGPLGKLGVGGKGVPWIWENGNMEGREVIR